MRVIRLGRVSFSDKLKRNKIVIFVMISGTSNQQSFGHSIGASLFKTSMAMWLRCDLSGSAGHRFHREIQPIDTLAFGSAECRPGFQGSMVRPDRFPFAGQNWKAVECVLKSSKRLVRQ